MRLLPLLALALSSCGGALVVPLYDEPPILARHPGLRGRVVVADGYVPGPTPEVARRWIEEGHEVSVEDTLRFQAEGVDREFVVPASGRVDFPRAGVITCAHRKIEDVRTALASVMKGEPFRLSVLAMDPDADVVVVGMVSYQGRVRRGAENLSRSLASAGYLSRKACLPQIVVVRPAEKKAIVCDYYRFAREKDERQNIKLFAGDVVVATALYDPDQIQCAPEWAPIELYFEGKLDRAGLIKALRK